MPNEFKTLKKFDAGQGREGSFHSLPALEEQGIGPISRLPVSIRIVLESVLRNCDGKKVGRKDVETLANWNAKTPANEEIPFVVARIVLQDFTGVPLRGRSRGDALRGRSGWAAIRKSSSRSCRSISWSITRCRSISPARRMALQLNLDMEFKRNRERYEFLKWGQQAFKTFGVVPPGIGIVHQVNLEYLAKGVLEQRRRLLSRHARRHRLAHHHDQRPRRRRLGRRRHRSGSRHARPAGLFPHAGSRRRASHRRVARRRHRDRSRAAHHADAARAEGGREIRRILRRRRGVAAGAGPRHDRQHGARVRRDHGLSSRSTPRSVNYLRATGRTDEQCAAFENYFKAQEMFGMPQQGRDRLQRRSRARSRPSCTERRRTEAPAGSHQSAGARRAPSAISSRSRSRKAATAKAGDDLERAPPRPAQRQPRPRPKTWSRPIAQEQGIEPGDELQQGRDGHRTAPRPMPATTSRPRTATVFEHGQSRIGHGSVLIAAITSCTNTSNPSVMLAAGLLAKKAVERGLTVDPVGQDFARAGLARRHRLPRQDRPPNLSRPARLPTSSATAAPPASATPARSIRRSRKRSASTISSPPRVLSGNRNFEARVHQNIKANFLMSPPLVVAFALAGRVDLDLTQRPARQGQGRQGRLPEGPLADA